MNLIEAGKRIYDKNLVVGTSGNISCKLDEGRILITAAGTCLGNLTDGDLVVVNLKGKVVKGHKNPSSEMQMHLKIYDTYRNIKAVIHTHSPYASAFAYLAKPLKTVNPESEMLLGEVAVSPYRPQGSVGLAEVVCETIKGRNAVLMEKHGVVTIGKNTARAVELAELVEETAKINYLVEMLGQAKS
ncbi:class II aldolase/adducin family protein [Candidatus Oleimmundimicrobium sp.]|uniref:class II aldolase/adducin family protein n=1 Tax=Candidatus Oleimmundimicrobium sp. TaxID=3060597 RepID=UPI002725E934|nr:class II aldolase/adducin family protein [Candidatus Oleimmundimicrobium sp.]MDO8886579.1 class II aldolase/adducin family protein [Candidatus Oleimmundimicrobium sp.]